MFLFIIFVLQILYFTTHIHCVGFPIVQGTETQNNIAVQWIMLFYTKCSSERWHLPFMTEYKTSREHLVYLPQS